MALHRDIFWVGRQWAVTGFGVQAVDQRLKGAFDVEAARLWEDDLPQRMRALAWINIEDFNRALDVARARFPEPPRKKGLPLVESVLELLQSSAPETPKAAPPLTTTGVTKSGPMQARPPETILPKPSPKESSPPPAEPPAIETPAIQPPAMQMPIDLPQPKSRPLAMRIEHVSAKFLPRWRVRH